MFGHFADALAVLETVARALDAAEEDMEPAAIGAGTSALRQTVRALGTVYDELDMLIVRSAPRAGLLSRAKRSTRNSARSFRPTTHNAFHHVHGIGVQYFLA